MSLTINATFVKNLPVVKGESARGPWVRGGFVVQHGEEYPKQAAFSLFGEDKVALTANIAPGTPVQVKFSPESREYEGRYYTDLRCISVAPLAQGAAYPAPPTAGQYAGQYAAPQPSAVPQPQAPAPAWPAQKPAGPEEDLPF